jgi:hypothetical protein
MVQASKSYVLVHRNGNFALTIDTGAKVSAFRLISALALNPLATGVPTPRGSNFGCPTCRRCMWSLPNLFVIA